MHQIIRSGEVRPGAGGTVTFEGEGYGSGVSIYLVNALPGAGPVPHTHPYPETWIVRSGRLRFRVRTEALEAGPGDNIVVGADNT